MMAKHHYVNTTTALSLETDLELSDSVSIAQFADSLLYIADQENTEARTETSQGSCKLRKMDHLPHAEQSIKLLFKGDFSLQLYLI